MFYENLRKPTLAIPGKTPPASGGNQGADLFNLIQFLRGQKQAQSVLPQFAPPKAPARTVPGSSSTASLENMAQLVANLRGTGKPQINPEENAKKKKPVARRMSTEG